MLTISPHRRSRDLSSPGTWKMRPPNLELSTTIVPAKYTTLCMRYRSLIQFPTSDLDLRLDISDPELFRLDGDTGTMQLQNRTEMCSSTNNYNMAGVTFFKDKYSPIDMHYCSTLREHSDHFPTPVVPNYLRSSYSDGDDIRNKAAQHTHTRTESKLNQPTQPTPAPLLTQGGSQVIPYMGTVILVSISSNAVCRLLILYTISQSLKFSRLRQYVTCRRVLISAGHKMKLEYRDMESILRPESNLLSHALVELAFTSIILACYHNILTVCLLLCSPSCKTHENARGRKKLRLGPSTCALPPPSAAAESPPPSTRVTEVKNTPPYAVEITSCTSGSSAALQNELHDCYTLYKLISPKYTSNVSSELSCICKYNTNLRELIDENTCQVTTTDPVYSCILVYTRYTYSRDDKKAPKSSKHSTIRCVHHLYNSMITPTRAADIKTNDTDTDVTDNDNTLSVHSSADSGSETCPIPNPSNKHAALFATTPQIQIIPVSQRGLTHVGAHTGQEPRDGECDGKTTGSKSSSSSSAGSHVSRATARTGFRRNRSGHISGDGEDDDGDKDRNHHGSRKINSQCENEIPLNLTPIKTKLDPKCIDITVNQEDLGDSTLLGRLSRQLMYTFNNITLFGAGHSKHDTSSDADSTFSLNISIASVNQLDQTNALELPRALETNWPTPIIHITPAKTTQDELSPDNLDYTQIDDKNQPGDCYFTGRGNPTITPVNQRNLLLLPRSCKARLRSRSFSSNRPYRVPPSEVIKKRLRLKVESQLADGTPVRRRSPSESDINFSESFEIPRNEISCIRIQEEGYHDCSTGREFLVHLKHDFFQADASLSRPSLILALENALKNGQPVNSGLFGNSPDKINELQRTVTRSWDHSVITCLLEQLGKQNPEDSDTLVPPEDPLLYLLGRMIVHQRDISTSEPKTIFNSIRITSMVGRGQKLALNGVNDAKSDEPSLILHMGKERAVNIIPKKLNLAMLDVFDVQLANFSMLSIFPKTRESMYISLPKEKCLEDDDLDLHILVKLECAENSKGNVPEDKNGKPDTASAEQSGENNKNKLTQTVNSNKEDDRAAEKNEDLDYSKKATEKNRDSDSDEHAAEKDEGLYSDIEAAKKDEDPNSNEEAMHEQAAEKNEDLNSNEQAAEKNEDLNSNEQTAEKNEDPNSNEQTAEKNEEPVPDKQAIKKNGELDSGEETVGKDEDSASDEQVTEKNKDLDSGEETAGKKEDSVPDEQANEKNGDLDSDEEIPEEIEDSGTDEQATENNEDLDPDEQAGKKNEDPDHDNQATEKDDDSPVEKEEVAADKPKIQSHWDIKESPIFLRKETYQTIVAKRTTSSTIKKWIKYCNLTSLKNNVKNKEALLKHLASIETGDTRASTSIISGLVEKLNGSSIEQELELHNIDWDPKEHISVASKKLLLRTTLTKRQEHFHEGLKSCTHPSSSAKLHGKQADVSPPELLEDNSSDSSSAEEDDDAWDSPDDRSSKNEKILQTLRKSNDTVSKPNNNVTKASKTRKAAPITNKMNELKQQRDKATTNCTSCESTEGALKVLESSILRLQEEMNKQKVNVEHLAKKLLEHQNNKDRQDQLRSKSKDDVNSVKKSFEDKTKTIFDTINVQQTCLDQITDSITKNERTVAKLKNRVESTETSNQKTHDQYKNELLVIRESLQNSEKNNAEIRKQLEASTQIHQPFESNSTRKSQTPRSNNLINQQQTPESAHMSMLLFMLSAVWNENQELKKKVMDSNRKRDTDATTKNEMQLTYIPMDFLIEEEEIEANTRVEGIDRRIRKQNPVNSDSKEVKATQPTNMSRAAQNLKPLTPKAAYKVEKDNKSTKTKKGLLDTPKNQPSISLKPDKVNPTSVAQNRDFPVPTATTRDNYSARETKKGLLATPNDERNPLQEPRGWSDFTINNVLEIDLEVGLEVKVVYDRRINTDEEFNLKFSNTHDLTISLGDGRCLYQGCPVGTLNMNTVQNGIAFILKIYREDGKLLIDLYGNKNVEIYMNTQGYWACSSFWGRDKNYEFQFTRVSANLGTHYRIEEEGSTDDNGIADWTEVTINKVLDMDIDLGIEIKLFYDKSKQLVLTFYVSASSSINFNLNLHDGMCTFQTCESQILDISTVQEGESFILKIYRQDGKLIIDLEGEKKVEVNINSQINTELECPAFWGREEIRTVSFPEKSRGVATHYKVGEENESDKDEKEMDTEDEKVIINN
ncbi:hypothetical protein ACHWQZ_G003666 [Mnemiopsis leidyi]